MLFARGEGREFQLPGGDGLIVMIAGGWAAPADLLSASSAVPPAVATPVGHRVGLLPRLRRRRRASRYAGWRMRARERPEAAAERPCPAPAPPTPATAPSSRLPPPDGDITVRAAVPARSARRRRPRERPVIRPRDRADATRPRSSPCRGRAAVLRGPAAHARSDGPQLSAPGGAYHCADDASPPSPAPASVADVAEGLRAVGYLPGESTALVVLPRDAARQAGARRGTGRRRQDRAGQGAGQLSRPRARAPAVLRGARRGQGAVRVELPQAAAAHPGRGRRTPAGTPCRRTSSARSSCSRAR